MRNSLYSLGKRGAVSHNTYYDNSLKGNVCGVNRRGRGGRGAALPAESVGGSIRHLLCFECPTVIQ